MADTSGAPEPRRRTQDDPRGQHGPRGQHDAQHHVGPPPPPDTRRQIRLYPAQWIGVPVLLLLPILALAGAFGETRATASVTHDGVRYDVEYPTRLRAGQHTAVLVRVTPLAGPAGDTVEVVFDGAWLDRFTRITAVPEPETPWRLLLPMTATGETAEARVEMEGSRLWQGEGTVRLGRAGGSSMDVVVRTLVFP
ncbi:MAG TPA: hypothetical protein VK929_11850 [Longimicrobiales bacterium]|nr:hypothetical protein [Longimicrobiales bacterium]